MTGACLLKFEINLYNNMDIEKVLKIIVTVIAVLLFVFLLYSYIIV